MAYCSAIEFWRDLRVQFGKHAKAVAFGYLDAVTAQAHRLGGDDPEELVFCCELFNLISNNDNGGN